MAQSETMTSPEKTPTEPSFEHMFTLRSEHRSGTLRLVAEATDSIAWLDDNYSQSGINSPEFDELIRGFLRADSKRRLRMLLNSDYFLQTQAPRFTNLLRTFSAQISTRLVHRDDWQGQAFLLVDGRHILTRAQADRWRGFLAFDACSQAEQLALKFDRIWDNGTPCLSPTTLGL